jgi:hypothetical protein
MNTNKDGTVAFLKAFGVSPTKIILGIAAYARAYILEDPMARQLNSPSHGQGFSGALTKTNGLLAYYEVLFVKCEPNRKYQIFNGFLYGFQAV